MIQDTIKELKKALGFFWTSFYSNTSYIDAYTTSVAIRAQTTIYLEQVLKKYLSRTDIPVYKLHNTRLFNFSTKDMDTDEYKYGGDITYNQAGITYDTNDVYPLSPSFKIGNFIPPYLSISIASPSSVLTLDVDYTVTNGWLKFKNNPIDNPDIKKIIINDGTQTYTAFSLWGFNTLEDQNDICNFFGSIIGISGYNDEKVKEVINLVWDIRVNGLTTARLHSLFCLLTGVDPVTEEGVVKDIYEEGDSVCVQTDNNLYIAPKETTVLTAVGKTIYPYTLIFDAFDIRYGTEVLESSFLAGLTIDKGYIYLQHGGGIHFLNERMPVETYKPKGWYSLERDGLNFIVRNRNGNITKIIPEGEATDFIDNLPYTHYRFAVGGHPKDVEDLMTRLNTRDENGMTFFEQLKLKYGKIPENINPFEELRDLYLQTNSLFIKLNNEIFEDGLSSQIFKNIRSLIPAGTTLFLSKELPILEEIYTGNSSESLDVFYIAEVDELEAGSKTELLAPVGNF
jgi:hypothetical protein